MRFLFVCIPDGGHITPIITVAATLASIGGHEVQVASLRPAKDKVEAKGLQFLDLGELTPASSQASSLGTSNTFAAGASPFKKLTGASDSNVRVKGLLMAQSLFAHLKTCSAEETPDVLVTDNMTLAGYEAAERFHLPLAVLPQYPLSQSLIMAGLNEYNMPAQVPLESLGPNTSQTASFLTRYLINPILKQLYYWFVCWVINPARNDVRKQLGLPAMTGGAFAVQEGVPRSIFIVGCSWELNCIRPLPANWHLVGPMGVDYSTPGSFPPGLDEGDQQIQHFMHQAQETKEPVVYVATGTMVVLQPFQVAAMATAFQHLAQLHHIRILWSLKKESQQLLPQKLALLGTDSSCHSGNSRMLITSWVIQPAVLAHERVKAFISHGGLGSTHEGLLAGIPIICMPFSGDQPTNAQQLVDRKLGVCVNPANLTAEKLVAAVQAVLSDGAYADNAAVVGRRLKAVSGPGQTAGLLIKFAENDQC